MVVFRAFGLQPCLLPTSRACYCLLYVLVVFGDAGLVWFSPSWNMSFRFLELLRDVQLEMSFLWVRDTSDDDDDDDDLVAKAKDW